MGIKVTGEKRLQQALMAYAPAFTRALQPAVNEGAAMVEAYAKQRAPVGEGELASKIESGPVRVTATEVVSETVSSAEHGPFVEFGTAHMAAQPFMRPAREQAKKQGKRLLATEAAKLIPQVARRVR